MKPQLTRTARFFITLGTLLAFAGVATVVCLTQMIGLGEWAALVVVATAVASGVINCCVFVGLAMRLDHNFHAWPSITRCRVCDHRVWAWQGHEQRNCLYFSDDSDGLQNVFGGRTLVHHVCMGDPTAPITIHLHGEQGEHMN